ncbi:hypothetical protein NDU88_006106 [Pleurodeles waltl]|uniref:Uncharacterized protein n=1 Tax=Pleurodeles waltl TaxID=8319 RepID=A0AAV7L6H6_PLEWA|nr:hypothetical protein NDU88_006106 [Pleurodeles waltl]
MRITRTQCAVYSRDANHKDTVRSALKSCGSKGHNTLCTQELRTTGTQCAVHSRAADHKERCVVHSRAADHMDTVRNALKSCVSQGHSA